MVMRSSMQSGQDKLDQAQSRLILHAIDLQDLVSAELTPDSFSVIDTLMGRFQSDLGVAKALVQGTPPAVAAA
jgi:hypothetical protein